MFMKIWLRIERLRHFVFIIFPETVQQEKLELKISWKLNAEIFRFWGGDLGEIWSYNIELWLGAVWKGLQ